MQSLAKKLLAIQKAIKPIVKTETNPYYKSQYFDINSVVAALRPILNECGVVVLQQLGHLEGKPAIHTTVIDNESGEQIESSALLPTITETTESTTTDARTGAEIKKVTEGIDAQKFGSVITYFRRYALVALFLLEAEDDDANSVIEVPPAPKPFVKKPITKSAPQTDTPPFPDNVPLKHGGCDAEGCNGLMVEKDTAKGKVLACSSYPACKNIRPL